MKMSSIECKVNDASVWTPRRNPSTSATSLYLLFLLKKLRKMFIQQGSSSSRWGQVLCFSFERQPLRVGHDIDMSKLREECNQNEIKDLQFLINYQITYMVVSFYSWNFVRLNWKTRFSNCCFSQESFHQDFVSPYLTFPNHRNSFFFW